MLYFQSFSLSKQILKYQEFPKKKYQQQKPQLSYKSYYFLPKNLQSVSCSCSLFLPFTSCQIDKVKFGRSYIRHSISRLFRFNCHRKNQKYILLYLILIYQFINLINYQ
ncbi:hypothetical protein PPERSA_09544 [Pseudocohnilembus persalinus]|uniref:Transmembrane protein n=1 Tax=Pseudocohnilembus persalinus TaxID=266149 RepID=A0A0V0QFH1_PSEPJ|nr:hypothetical protein PPERSA_09544 [Pseudocohnilembus persalinus]|eukprot:KRX00938.1 hypothetical protein PPERSA_09544 [Pseudocohnilembus persalinus]